MDGYTRRWKDKEYMGWELIGKFRGYIISSGMLGHGQYGSKLGFLLFFGDITELYLANKIRLISDI